MNSDTINNKAAKEVCHKERIAVFPGSFNPFTKGHADIVDRALRLFDRVVVAVGFNEHKTERGEVDAIVAAVADYYSDEPRVDAVAYTGLTVELVGRLKADCIVRGVRNITDYEYERNLADVNREIADVETVFILCRPELGYISASMVRELDHNGFDTSGYVAARAKR